MKEKEMKSPRMCRIFLLAVFSGAGMVHAANWTGQGSEMYWDIGQNWSNGAIPTATDSQNVVNVLAEDGTALHPVVYTLEGGTDVCANLYLGTTVDGTLGDGTLDMIDGHLSVAGNVFLGNQAGAAGLINMEDGYLEVTGQFNVGQYGDGHLRMAGGHIIAHGTWMHIPNAGNSTGRVDLFGGTLETTATFITRSVARSLVDLSGGKIVVPTANAGNLAGFIADGRIIAYGGRGTVKSEILDSNTVLTGTADPEVMARAWHQSPAEGATLFTVAPTLAWVAGEDANAHRVYLGTDPATLELLPAEPNQGVLSVDFYTKLEDLTPGTTYYWRVDEIAADAGVTTGDTWSFATVPPETSRSVSPADGSHTDETTGVVLTWEPGVNAVSFNVYWAAGADELGLVSEAQTESTYPVPGILIPGQTYRWRIDTSNGTDLFPGLEVSFKAGNPPASTTWTDGAAGDSSWNNAENWNGGVPGIGSIARHINGVGDCVVEDGTAAYCQKLELGWSNAAESEVIVSGGSLTIVEELLLSRMLGGVSTLSISGGVVNCGWLRGWHGDMWVEMTGGEFNCAGNLEIPRAYAADIGTAGVFNLHGGMARAGDLTLNANPNVVCNLDITGGTLILDGDKRTKVNGYIAGGLITAYGGLETASVSMDYDISNAGKTTVIACAQSWQADFNADCVVDDKDRELLMSDWGYQTPSETTWDFDMSDDPVGPGAFDLLVRNAANSSYDMISLPGTLNVTGPLLLDERGGTNGLWDADLHYVGKVQSDDDNSLNLWITLGTPSAPGSQAYVGLRHYLDTATHTQTIAFWTGSPPHIAPFEPVSATGFAPDAMVEVTIHYDYENQTYDWNASDGTLARSGTAVPYTAFNGGYGGNFTIQGVASCSAYIDHFTFTIHGSSSHSPYDINLDGSVDQLDLDILEAEMAQ
jgi:hypothetical protein